MRTLLSVLIGIVLLGAVSGCAQDLPSLPEPTATSRARTALFIGDSYTQGAGATDQAHGFAALVAQAEGWNATNLGRGGTGHVTANLDGLHACGTPYCGDYGNSVAAVALAQPDVVVVSGGLNDVHQSEATFTSGVDQFMGSLAVAAGEHTRVYITSPLSPGIDVPHEFAAEGPVLRAAAAKYGFRYLDLGQPIAGRLELLYKDRVHPNDAGHALIARAVEQQIKAAS